jgi:dTDP-4-amino-4,6-dideoxygalactose transaminase
MAEGKTGKAHSAKEKYRARVVGGEVAEDLFNRGLCLPLGTAPEEADLERIVEVIKECCQSK